ncbi:MAG: hypothetical protein LBJ87_09330 [bacterium]|nr:hypothetical protein [bacterium]
MGEPLDREADKLRDSVHAEVAGWHPRRRPDMHDLMQRADTSWKRPVIVLSTAGATGLALVLVFAVALIMVAPAFPVAETIRAHLLAH